MIGDANVTLPGAFGAGTDYRVIFSGNFDCHCENSEPGCPTPMQIYAACVARDSTISVIALGEDPSTGYVAFSDLFDVPYTSGPIDLVFPAWRTDFNDWSIEAANTTGLTLHATISAGLGRRGRGFLGASHFGADVDDGWSETVGGTLPAVDADDEIWISVEYFDPSTSQQFVRKQSGGAPDVSIDAVDLDPAVDTVLVDDPTSIAPHVSWTGAPAPLADLVKVEYVSRFADVKIVHHWSVIAPPDATSVSYPTLPPELASWLPPVAGVSRRVSVHRIGATLVDSYEEALAIELNDGHLLFGGAGLLLPPEHTDTEATDSMRHAF